MHYFLSTHFNTNAIEIIKDLLWILETNENFTPTNFVKLLCKINI